MRIAIVGLGSMGTRRIRLLKEMYPEYTLIGVDNKEIRRIEASEKYGMECYESLRAVELSIDCVFVCTSPLFHYEIICEALLKESHVFTELNLIPDGYEEMIRLAEEKSRVLFLSSPFLYREEMKYIRSRVTGGKWNYIYHIGQYLPDWHPWENYQEMFLSESRTNGCREILSIELPWLTETFGCVQKYSVMSDKMTDLDIEYKDNYMIQLTHADGNKGVLIVDVVSPVAVRKLEIYKEKHYLSWTGTPESLIEYNLQTGKMERAGLLEKPEHLDAYSAFIIENAYRAEIKAFFDAVCKGVNPEYGFEQDYRVLNLINSMGVD